MNTTLFWKIYSLSGDNYWLDKFMIFSAEWLGYLLVLGIIILFVANRRKYLNLAVVSIGSAIIGRGIFVTTIRFFYEHPRPFMVFDNINKLIDHDVTSSFPSGHATFFFALAAGVYLYNKKLGVIYFVLAGLIGFARVFAGVHLPYDIVSGFVVGILSGLLIQFLITKSAFRGAIRKISFLR